MRPGDVSTPGDCGQLRGSVRLVRSQARGGAARQSVCQLGADYGLVRHSVVVFGSQNSLPVNSWSHKAYSSSRGGGREGRKLIETPLTVSPRYLGDKDVFFARF